MTTVFYFNRSFLQDLSRIQQIPEILQPGHGQALVVVAAAISDARDQLKQVAKHYFIGNQSEALQQFHQIKSAQLEIAKSLLGEYFGEFREQASDLFTEIEWLMHDHPVRHFEYYHDQIVCLGELIGSNIISHFLRRSGLENTWMDVRDLIRTDHQFMQATIDEEASRLLIEKNISTIISANPAAIILTQSNIGATEDNESTGFELNQEHLIPDFFAKALNAELIQNS